SALRKSYAVERSIPAESHEKRMLPDSASTLRNAFTHRGRFFGVVFCCELLICQPVERRRARACPIPTLRPLEQEHAETIAQRHPDQDEQHRGGEGERAKQDNQRGHGRRMSGPTSITRTNPIPNNSMATHAGKPN